MTIAGLMAAGPATDALDPEFSVPDKEGWETNVDIAQKYRGTGGDTSPLVPVVQLPEGTRADSPSVKADLAKVDRSLAKALPGSRVASYASTGDDAFISKDGRTTFAVVYPQPDPDSAFGENPKAEKAASAVLEDAKVAGQPVHLTGSTRCRGQRRGQRGHGLLLEAVLGGSARRGAHVRVRGFLAISPISWRSSDHDTSCLAGPPGPSVSHRAVPDALLGLGVGSTTRDRRVALA